MVTIEQKLAVFRKLLKNSMEQEFTTELSKIEKEYETKTLNHKEKIDREADQLIKKATKKANQKEVEFESQIKVSLKRKLMQAREDVYVEFISKLRERIDIFMDSDNYLEFLINNLKSIENIEDMSGKSIISISEKDFDKYREAIEVEAKKVISSSDSIEIKKTSEDIIGGFIVENSINNTRINMTIRSLLEENESYIISTLFEAVGEVGDLIEQ